MKVRAIRLGYYDDKRRRAGDVFTLGADGDFTASWMVPVDLATPERQTGPQAALDALHDAQGLAPTRRRAPAVDIDTRADHDFDPFR